MVHAGFWCEAPSTLFAMVPNSRVEHKGVPMRCVEDSPQDAPFTHETQPVSVVLRTHLRIGVESCMCWRHYCVLPRGESSAWQRKGAAHVRGMCLYKHTCIHMLV